ncbi:MAG TPA: HAMP domain-containing sensor histidine kinase [Chloroflexota bacterium]|nr:HAMP domain-containing sensor histidine kinase [Chloroflexota bacterium]
MSLRTRIVLLNAAILAIALVAAATALVGLWSALGPVQRAVEEEAQAVAVAEQLGLQPAQADLIETALENARLAEQDAAQTALIASAAPIALLAAGGIACAVFSLRLSRHVLQRLGALGDATRRVAAGDRTVRVPTPDDPATRRDELDALGASFNAMVARLADAEARARDAEAARGRFFAGVSHDLRTPLTTISGLLESLRRETWDGATSAEFLEVAHREAQRLTRLVTDLLDLSRLDAHAWTVEREPVDVAALAESVTADLAAPGGPLAGRAATVHGDGRPTAWADELQLRRVLQNLLVNAATYSPRDAPVEVDVAADPTGGVVRVSVADRGPGVPPEDAARIFDRFYRGAAPREKDKEPAPGTGLGLAIARGIVDSHGGRIWVEPRGDGHGARFVFTVPTTPQKTSHTTAAGPAAQAAEASS